MAKRNATVNTDILEESSTTYLHSKIAVVVVVVVVVVVGGGGGGGGVKPELALVMNTLLKRDAD